MSVNRPLWSRPSEPNEKLNYHRLEVGGLGVGGLDHRLGFRLKPTESETTESRWL